METKRSPRTQRKRPWMQIEYLLGGLSLLIVLVMLLMTASDLYFAIRGNQKRTFPESEEDNYVTYIYNGFGRNKTSGTGGDEEEDYDTALVDVTQFAGDTGYAGALYALRYEYAQADEILARYENAVLTVDGEETTVGQIMENAIPERLVQMAADYPQTMDYVLTYPTKIGQEVEMDTSDITTSQVPSLIQWDERWGYQTYGDGLLGYTGCGPTCLSMVAIYMTGDTSLTPDVVAQYAQDNGFYETGSGSSWTLMWDGAAHYGLTAVGATMTESGLLKALEYSPVICSVQEGDFTKSGHFIVITGYENGAFTVNDPNSVENSRRSWSFSELSPQLRSGWFYT